MPRCYCLIGARIGSAALLTIGDDHVSVGKQLLHFEPLTPWTERAKEGEAIPEAGFARLLAVARVQWTALVLACALRLAWHLRFIPVFLLTPRCLTGCCESLFRLTNTVDLGPACGLVAHLGTTSAISVATNTAPARPGALWS